jgi:lipopolysaccharide transport system permease protein
MSKIVYTSEELTRPFPLTSPYQIMRNLLNKQELILACARRDFHASYRETLLGAVWPVLSPLIMLAMFTLVFGYIFGGRFDQSAHETPAEFALALFVGLSLYMCVGNTLTSAPSLILGNAGYVKTLSFPLEVLSVSADLNLLANLLIGLGLCVLGFLAIHGFLHWTAVFLVPLVVCIGLMSLGLSWLLSALGVFVRDLPSVTSPISTVLMFVSGVFFPISSIPRKIVWFFEINPIAVIIDQARGCLLYGKIPNLIVLAAMLVISFAFAVGGYWFFMRTKPAFADVL